MEFHKLKLSMVLDSVESILAEVRLKVHHAPPPKEEVLGFVVETPLAQQLIW